MAKPASRQPQVPLAPEQKTDREKPQPLPPLDEAQRYTVPEASAYLRMSRGFIYELIKTGSLRSFTDGKRRYVPGSEIARRSRMPA